MNDETQQTDAGQLEKEEIEDLGTVTLARGGHVIHCLTVIGQIEGHSEAPRARRPRSTSMSSRSWWPRRRTPASRACWCC